MVCDWEVDFRLARHLPNEISLMSARQRRCKVFMQALSANAILGRQFRSMLKLLSDAHQRFLQGCAGLVHCDIAY
jgi:hypothetical protein